MMIKRHLFSIISATFGALAGFAYWKFVGCAGGTCPLWSNPFIATGYGALLGFLIGGLFQGKKKESDGDTSPAESGGN